MRGCAKKKIKTNNSNDTVPMKILYLNELNK